MPSTITTPTTVRLLNEHVAQLKTIASRDTTTVSSTVARIGELALASDHAAPPEHDR
jgi:predicted DNA-binding ribbon-helix-helix protein